MNVENLMAEIRSRLPMIERDSGDYGIETADEIRELLADIELYLRRHTDA